MDRDSVYGTAFRSVQDKISKGFRVPTKVDQTEPRKDPLHRFIGFPFPRSLFLANKTLDSILDILDPWGELNRVVGPPRRHRLEYDGLGVRGVGRREKERTEGETRNNRETGNGESEKTSTYTTYKKCTLMNGVG